MPTSPRQSESIRLTLRVKPRASRDEVSVKGDRLEVRVTAPPVEGEANAACLRLLARRLALPPSAVTLVRGARSPVKLVSIRGLSLAEVRARLGAPDGA